MKETNFDNKLRSDMWLYPETFQKIDSNLKLADCKNRSDFIEKAVDFYCGFLGTQNSTNYLSKILVETIGGVLKETENRQSANLFRLSVELSIMMNILAAGLDISDDDLRELRGKCVTAVKRTKGKINMDETIRNLQMEND